MSQSSAAIPLDESEFEFCGLESAPSYRVVPPRVAQSPAALECRVVEIRQLQGLDGALPELVRHRWSDWELSRYSIYH